MHQKEKSMSILKEIDEALAKSNKPISPMLLDKRERDRTSMTFSENKSKILNTFDNLKKKNPTIQDQINNSFKNLSIQTINTLISLKNDVNNKQNSNKKTEKIDKSPYNNKKNMMKSMNVTDLTKEKRNRINAQIKNLQSNRSLDNLIEKLQEKMKTFQDNYQNINEKIENLLVEMKPEGENRNQINGSPWKNNIIPLINREDANYYTFQKTKKEGSSERYAKKNIERFQNE